MVFVKVPLESMVFQFLFTSEPLLPMVFYISTIGINGFTSEPLLPIVVFISTIGINGFWSDKPLIPMVLQRFLFQQY